MFFFKPSFIHSSTADYSVMKNVQLGGANSLKRQFVWSFFISLTNNDL